MTLIHPVFAQFVQDCKTYEPTEVDYKLERKLSREMSRKFPSEKERAAAFRDIMTQDYGIPLKIGRIAAYTTDGDAREESKHDQKQYIYLITEAKNELGSGGHAEPTFQSSLYYFEYLREFSDKPPLLGPCLHIIYAGGYTPVSCSRILTTYVGATFLIYGSAFSDRVHLDVLKTISLCYHPDEPGQSEDARKVLGSVNKAVNTLREYYCNLKRPDPDQIWRDSKFPYMTKYTSIKDGSSIDFIYMLQPNAGKKIFIAKATNNKTPLFVKFVVSLTRDYPQHVHAKLADAGLAPPLLGCEALPAGWTMVVMEMKSPEEYRPYSGKPEDGFLFPPLECMHEQARSAVQKMHELGFVHGDLRNVNILVRRQEETDGTAPPILLCDLDWAGEHGKVCYPMGIADKKVWRPTGVKGGVEMTQQHDLDMVSKAFSFTPSAVGTQNEV